MHLGCRQRQRRPRHSLFWPGRLSIICRGICPPQLVRHIRQFSDRSRMRGRLRMRSLIALAAVVALAGCGSARRDPNTVVVLIESSPANLDPRIGTDVQSQRIDALLFDGLVARDAHFQFTPALAERWDQPNPLTLVFHLRDDVHFHDGRALTAGDVVWTIKSMIDAANPGGVITPKAASYASIDTLEAPDDRTVVMHLKHPDNFLLSNLSTGAMGVVPAG